MEEGTASLQIVAIVDPSPEGNDCFFRCLLLILAEGMATDQLTAVALTETCKTLLGDGTNAVGVLMPLLLHISNQPSRQARAAMGEALFRSAGCSAALVSLRQVVHAALVQALQAPKGKAAIDESHIEPADVQLVRMLGAAVPIGVCLAFLNMLPIRVAVVTEGCDGLVSRHDAGGDLGAPLLCGLLVCKNHVHTLLASEISLAVRNEPVHVPPPKSGLTLVVHLHGSASVIKVSLRAEADVAEAISSLVSHLPDGQWRVVADKQPLAVEHALPWASNVAILGSVLHVLPYVLVGGFKDGGNVSPTNSGAPTSRGSGAAAARALAAPEAKLAPGVKEAPGVKGKAEVASVQERLEELVKAKAAAEQAVAEAKAAEAERSRAQVAMEKAGQMIAKAMAAAESVTVQLPAVAKLAPFALDGETASEKWSLLSWAEGAAVHRIVAAAICQPLVDKGLGGDSDAALGLLRGLKDRAALAKLLRTEAMIEGIIDLVWAGTEALQRAGAATSSEIQSKFAGAIELSYGGLDKFFGGLEAIVGGPNPKLLEGMEGEHLNGPGTESTDTFTPGNYGITTSSLIEWKFIVDEEATPKQLGLDRWPEESVEKLPDRSLCRKHRPLADIKKEAEYRNEQLAKGKNSGLGVEELIAAISYTGPVMPSSQCCPLVSYFSIGPP
jgi:hypothetical protein